MARRPDRRDALLARRTTRAAAWRDRWRPRCIRASRICAAKCDERAQEIPAEELDDARRREIVRILELWAQARARYGGGGPFLFGTFGAVDIMFAPVVTRFVTYGAGPAASPPLYMKNDPRRTRDAPNGSTRPRTSPG